MQRSFGNEPLLYIAGYQGRDLDAFARLVLRVGVTQVIDIRERPTSRRLGFAKSPLSKALVEAGISYVHVREAGSTQSGSSSAVRFEVPSTCGSPSASPRSR